MRKVTLLFFIFFTALGYAQNIELNGTISAENNQIKNVADPTEIQDVATKNYTYSKEESNALIANLQAQVNNLSQDTSSNGKYQVTNYGAAAGDNWSLYRYIAVLNTQTGVIKAYSWTYIDGTLDDYGWVEQNNAGVTTFTH